MDTGCTQTVEELAEAYCLNRLSNEHRRAFEKHCTECAGCAAVLDRVQLFLKMMRSAAKHLKLHEPDRVPHIPVANHFSAAAD